MDFTSSTGIAAILTSDAEFMQSAIVFMDTVLHPITKDVFPMFNSVQTIGQVFPEVDEAEAIDGQVHFLIDYPRVDIFTLNTLDFVWLRQASLNIAGAPRYEADQVVFPDSRPE